MSDARPPIAPRGDAGVNGLEGRRGNETARRNPLGANLLRHERDDMALGVTEVEGQGTARTFAAWSHTR